jgi:hypothetical protein
MNRIISDTAEYGCYLIMRVNRYWLILWKLLKLMLSETFL